MQQHESQFGDGAANATHEDRVPRSAPRRLERPTIHFTQLPGDTSGGRGATEWNYYLREVGRLLADGHEGRWVLIKGEEVVGIWDTEAEANRIRLQRFLMQDVLIHQIRTHEPVLRGLTCQTLLDGRRQTSVARTLPE
jgi:hypothetical protein